MAAEVFLCAGKRKQADKFIPPTSEDKDEEIRGKEEAPSVQQYRVALGIRMEQTHTCT